MQTVTSLLGRLIDAKEATTSRADAPAALAHSENLLNLQLQVSPLLDRVGRFMSDFSGLLMKEIELNADNASAAPAHVLKRSQSVRVEEAKDLELAEPARAHSSPDAKRLKFEVAVPLIQSQPLGAQVHHASVNVGARLLNLPLVANVPPNRPLDVISEALGSNEQDLLVRGSPELPQPELPPQLYTHPQSLPPTAFQISREPPPQHPPNPPMTTRQTVETRERLPRRRAARGTKAPRGRGRGRG